MAPTPTIPRNADELAEMLADGAKLREVMASRESLTEFITAYGNALQGEGTDLNRLVAEETQRVFAQMMRENGMGEDGRAAMKRLDLDPQAKRRGMLTSHRKGTAHNPAAPGASLDPHFTDSVEYARTIWHKSPEAEVAEKLTILRNAASSVSPADGGFLVPETLRSQLLQIALEQSVVRPLATVIPMDSARVPMPLIDSTTNKGSVFGGMIAYWGEESAMLQDANPKFARVELDAKKLTGLSAVPNELLQDSIVSFASLIETLWPQALAFSEDQAFMTGTGAGMPLGFFGAKNKAAVTVTRTTSGKIQYVETSSRCTRRCCRRRCRTRCGSSPRTPCRSSCR
ncbi:Phage major capsid protein OS=Streptomyces fumanus OX=67302 GN=GCM10018772_05230 PE=4 SV=1 [Streptomyces fumanus]